VSGVEKHRCFHSVGSPEGRSEQWLVADGTGAWLFVRLLLVCLQGQLVRGAVVFTGRVLQKVCCWKPGGTLGKSTSKETAHSPR
jgi:hypothetical protein